MSKSVTADIPFAAHAKGVQALEEFESLVSQYEMLLDTQQVLVRTANFAALFEMAARGDRLARDADLCGKRFAPLVDAVASGQFAGPRAAEIRRRSFSARSHAETLSSASSRLANACSSERDMMGRELRKSHASSPQAGLPPGYRTDSRHYLDRRG